MNVFDQIQQSGWGALFLFVYSALVLQSLSYEVSNLMFPVIAGSPSLILIFFGVAFNDWLMDLFVGKDIREAFKVIDNRTGDEEFYWDAEPDVRAEIDKMDKKAHQYLVSILSGTVISGSLPFVVYYIFGLSEAIITVVCSVTIAYLLCYRRFQSLRQVVKSSVKLYNTDNEN